VPASKSPLVISSTPSWACAAGTDATVRAAARVVVVARASAAVATRRARLGTNRAIEGVLPGECGRDGSLGGQAGLGALPANCVYVVSESPACQRGRRGS